MKTVGFQPGLSGITSMIGARGFAVKGGLALYVTTQGLIISKKLNF